MLYEPVHQNYRTSSRLVGAHSANGRTSAAVRANRAVPQFTLKNSTGIGTSHSREVLSCAAPGAIRQEMVRSHWSPAQIPNAGFDQASTNELLPVSGGKPQQTRVTRQMQREVRDRQHAGVSSAFSDPIQRQAHHPWHDSTSTGPDHYRTVTRSAHAAPPAEARQRVQPSLTMRHPNPNRITPGGGVRQTVAITDVLESHISLGGEEGKGKAYYETTTAHTHKPPTHQPDPHKYSRTAGQSATHPLSYDPVFHRQRVNPAISPFEHFSPAVSVRRSVPRSTQHSYNIITGQSMDTRQHTTAASASNNST